MWSSLNRCFCFVLSRRSCLNLTSHVSCPLHTLATNNYVTANLKFTGRETKSNNSLILWHSSLYFVFFLKRVSCHRLQFLKNIWRISGIWGICWDDWTVDDIRSCCDSIVVSGNVLRAWAHDVRRKNVTDDNLRLCWDKSENGEKENCQLKSKAQKFLKLFKSQIF